MHTQILKSCSKTVLVVDEKKTKILKMKQLENTFFFSNLCFFNLVGVILILKSSRQGFEIFISKSQMFLLKRFGCSSHFFHSRISINIYNDIFQVKDFEL